MAINFEELGRGAAMACTSYREYKKYAEENDGIVNTEVLPTTLKQWREFLHAAIVDGDAFWTREAELTQHTLKKSLEYVHEFPILSRALKEVRNND